MATNGTVYPKADVIEFQPNTPVVVATKYAQPKLIAPKFPGGEERAMFSLVDGRLMFLDAEDARQVSQLGIRPGQPFSVEMKWSGRRGDPKIYHVCKVEAAHGQQNDGTFSVPAGRPSPVQMARDTTADLEAQLQASIKAVEENKARLKREEEEARKRAEAAATAPAPQSATQHDTTPAQNSTWDLIERQSQKLIDMYAGLCKYAADRHAGVVTKDDVRALLMNRLIGNENRGGVR